MGSFLLLYWSGLRMVNSISKVCRFLGWREFVVAFFIMSLATSLPNFFIDINAALQNIPQFAFGDIVGGNIVDLTLVIGLAIIISNISLPAESKMVQSTAVFTVAIAIIPLALIMDSKLTRIDGLILIFSFFVYAVWLFGKRDRFEKDYDDKYEVRIKDFLKGLSGIFIFAVFLLAASQGIILSSQYFSSYFSIGLPIIGILLVGLSNCASEGYLAVVLAKRKENWMILGNLMGSVIVCSTLVLGIVILIRPFEIADFSPFAVARIFLIVSALFFLLMLKTGKTITKIEGLILIALYFLFVLSVLYINIY